MKRLLKDSVSFSVREAMPPKQHHHVEIKKADFDGHIRVSCDERRSRNTGSAPSFQSGFIAKIHELQDALAALPDSATEFNLPQVVVIGGQSSGKSSVLEALVGRDFLPKDSTICTRRPLVLQLTRTTQEEEWGQFRHIPNVKFVDFDKIRQEIEEETTRGTCSQWAVSSEPIYLKIFSPNVLSMALIDMPGIVRVPVEDQPPDIEQILSDMTSSFAKAESTIILAVTAANSDIANSDALKIAKKVDPQGIRTLGVLTKLDIMDDGVDVASYLRGERDPRLLLGYVGVVNRSQASIDGSVTIHQTLRQEQAWFSSSSKAAAYKELGHLCGTASLAKKLNMLLTRHIQQRFQLMAVALREKTIEVEDRLEKIGTEEILTQEARTEALHTVLHDFEKKFNACVSGDMGVSAEHLVGGAVLLHHFRMLRRDLEVAQQGTAKHSDAALLHTIHNAYGMGSHVLIPEKAFRQLVPETVRAMRAPCIKCANTIHNQFLMIAETALGRVSNRFPVLKTRLREITEDVLRATLRPAMEAIDNVFDLEEAHINTEHPQFIRGEEAVKKASAAMEKRRGKGAQSDEFTRFVCSAPQEGTIDGRGEVRLEIRDDDLYGVELTRILLLSYSRVVCQTVQDIVPKVIVHFFINRVRYSALRSAFLVNLNHPEIITRLIAEDPGLEKERFEVRNKLEVYRRAISVLLESPSTTL